MSEVSDAELEAIYARIDAACDREKARCGGDEIEAMGNVSTEVHDLIALRAALYEARTQRMDAWEDEDLAKARAETDAEIAAHYATGGWWRSFRHAYEEVAELTAERDDARAEVETLRAEAGLMREQIGEQEVSLSATINRLREEKAELRTQVDVVGDAQQRIAAAWNQIAGHFLVSPSPANAERIARLACAAADVRDEATATRDEAVAEVRRLTAALATARREGAELMRARAAKQAEKRRSETGDDIADEIRALPLDAPGGAS